MQWYNSWCHWHHTMLMLVPMASLDQKSHVHLLFIILTSQVEWYQWWHCWHHVTLTPSMDGGNQNVEPHFDYLDWRNVVVSLLMALTSHGANADAYAKPSQDQKYHVASPFDHLELRNGMMPRMILLESCNTWHKNHDNIWTKSYVTHCFNHLDLMNRMVLLTMAFA